MRYIYFVANLESIHRRALMGIPYPSFRWAAPRDYGVFAKVAPKIIRPILCDVVVSFGRMISQDVLRSGGGSHRVFLQKLGDEGGLGRRIWHDLSLYHQSLLALERRQFQAGHYKRILAVSEEVKRELLDVYAVPEDKVTVIYNGVDEKRFHLSLRDKFRELIRKQWHIPLDAPTSLICGKRVPPEGAGRLLKVWSSPQMKDTGSKLWLARMRSEADTKRWPRTGPMAKWSSSVDGT